MGFPEQLKKARLAQGLTQQQVADAMGITNSTYCGYETGKRQPDVPKIQQLARILKTSGDALLETGFDVSSKKEPEGETPYKLSKEEYEVILRYRNATSEAKDYIDYILNNPKEK